MTARDIRYGRRGGRWASGSGRLLDEIDRLRDWHRAHGTWPEPVDRSARSHPREIARARTHDRAPTCTVARDPKHATCDCQPDPDDLAAVWAGRARMAAARRAAGRTLDDIDREALAQMTAP